MRESSPALGGAITAAAIICSLAYGMGYGHTMTSFLAAGADQVLHWLNTVFDLLRQMAGQVF